MGLDMYLYKKTYVKNWDYMQPEDRHQITVTKGGKPTDIKPERISEITEEVAYWRKANAIHKWFVDNVQNGLDDCGEYYVERDQLTELVRLCKEVLGTVEQVDGEVPTGTMYYPDGTVVHETKPGQVVAQAKIAADMLPTQGGFFFGGTEYDEYYLQDLQSTIDQLEPLITEEGDGSFYYHSSW